MEPSSTSGDFLTLGAAGAFTRGEAVNERVDTAILGLTFVYIREQPPEQLALDFDQLPANELPITIIDPNGNRGVTLTATLPTATWENDGALEALVLAPVDATSRTWAPLALIVLAASVIAIRKPKVGYTCVAASIVLFPVGRAPMPFTAMEPEQAEVAVEQLLSNVYHAFDHREEAAVYDQLTISVTGDQLTDIYLGQRRALELENRGGARARVETVEVDAIDSVKRTKGGLDVVARWNVSGSVNHFGHTHYRRNAYHATLRLAEIEGAWKITGIEVHEEERVY